MKDEQEKETQADQDDNPILEFSDPAVMAKTPLISVKTITYNHEAYIARAIEGIVCQKTNFPFELVIAEDCSTDRTREIIFEYQKKYPDIIRLITSKKNVGMRANSNRVNKFCRGKYLAFCEGDDYWNHPGKLQMQVEYLESHPECGLAHTDMDLFDLKRNKKIPNLIKKSVEANEDNIMNGMILNEYLVGTCTVVMTKKLYHEIRETCAYEFSGIFPMGDVQMWMEIAVRAEIKFFPVITAVKNVLVESMSNNKDMGKRVRFAKGAKSVHLHYAKKYGGKDTDELKNKITARFNKSLLRVACRAKKPELAREILEDSRQNKVEIALVDYLFYYSAQKGVFSTLLRAKLLTLLRMKEWFVRLIRS